MAESKCPTLSWINFLPSSWYNSLILIQDENNVVNILMFQLLLSSVYAKSRISLLFIQPHQQGGWGCPRSCDGTQMIPADLRNIPDHVVACPACRAGARQKGRMFRVMVLGWSTLQGKEAPQIHECTLIKRTDKSQRIRIQLETVLNYTLGMEIDILIPDPLNKHTAVYFG